MVGSALLWVATWSASAGPGVADWPQWRGPTRDGVVAEGAGRPWPRGLSERELVKAWRADLGVSFASPVVAGGRVFCAESSGKEEVVRALDRATGKQIWEARWGGEMSVPFFAMKMGSWVRSTPAVDAAGGSLLVGGMRDVLVCLNVADGTERWRVDFVARNKAPVPAFGFVSTPLIRGVSVSVLGGGAVVTLTRAPGETAWTTLADGGGMNGSAFSSPVFATLAGVEQLLVQTRSVLAGVDPETGKPLWTVPVPAFRGMNIVDPLVVHPGAPGNPARVFTTAYGAGSFLFEVSRDPANAAWSVREVWKNVAVEGYMGTPVVVAGHAYVHGRDRRFHCLDLSTGKRTWATDERFGEYWSIVSRGPALLALDQRGELLAIRANPEKFELLARRKVADQDTWAHLAVCGDELWVRELRGLSRWDWIPGDNAK
jgi:outer membrane protein assembly factor BamB